MKQKFLILFLILLIITFVSLLWWNQAIKPPNPLNKSTVNFIIKRGESVKDIAEKLQKQGLIRSSVAFFLLARFGGLAQNIQSGNSRLSPTMDMFAIADTLTHGTSDIQITIPEGWRNEEISLRLAKELNIPENEFLKIAKVGYMFPDTYFIPKDATPGSIIKIFFTNFDKKIADSIKEKARQNKLTLYELITIASLVEREAKFDQDRPLVANVILNRLKLGMKLDIDASIQYALGYQAKEKSWWKKELTKEDLEIDSPYNTYKNPGLPPTPIANPGLAAILAVVNALKTDYLYYISDKTGKIHFAKTIEEHNVNITKYLNQ